MSEINIRPRIREEVNYTAETVKNKFTNNIKNYPEQLIMSSVGNHFNISIHEKIHHFWSPQVSINIEETDSTSIIRGLIGPKPNLWATFMVIYVFGFSAFTISAVIGYSHLTMNKSGIMLYISPLFLLIVLATYLITITGKKLAKQQTKLIKDFILESI